MASMCTWTCSVGQRRQADGPTLRPNATRAGPTRLAGSVSVADQAWALLLQVGFELVSAHFASAVADVDLAPAQARALHELDLEQPISMRELADRLKADPSNVAGLVDRLEARGLVERRRTRATDASKAWP